MVRAEENLLVWAHSVPFSTTRPTGLNREDRDRWRGYLALLGAHVPERRGVREGFATLSPCHAHVTVMDPFRLVSCSHK